MPWYIWLLAANVFVSFVEYSYRSGDYQTFLQALPYVIAPIILAQMALFYGFRGAPSLLLAGACFSLINVAIRVRNVVLLGEHEDFQSATS